MSKELFNKLDSQLQGRNKNQRKTANNTYLVRRDKNIALMLHVTDIFTIKPNGEITLDTEGWKTPATKDRLNGILPGSMNIYQEKSEWYLTTGRWNDNPKSYIFEDGMKIGPRGKIYATERSGKKDKKKAKWVNQVNAFCKELVEQAFNGTMHAPSNGDCWYCLMKTADGKAMGDLGSGSDHIKSHIEEKYYVPSLFWNAMVEGREKYLSTIAQGNLAILQMKQSDKECNQKYCMLDVVKSNYLKAVKVYVKKRLGLPL